MGLLIKSKPRLNEAKDYFKIGRDAGDDQPGNTKREQELQNLEKEFTRAQEQSNFHTPVQVAEPRLKKIFTLSLGLIPKQGHEQGGLVMDSLSLSLYLSFSLALSLSLSQSLVDCSAIVNKLLSLSLSRARSLSSVTS